MAGQLQEALSEIHTVAHMTVAFADERRCRELLEQLAWPKGRICPFCGFRRSTLLVGRDSGHRARPGLYQCASSTCRHQFTVTTRTPLHATKLPLRVWLTAAWLILQSDKGLSSPKLAEALGVSQPTAWRLGHAVRLMLHQERPLAGVVEADEIFVGSPPDAPERPNPGRGRKGLPRKAKITVLSTVERPLDLSPGAPAGEVRAQAVENRSNIAIGATLEQTVDPGAHLMSDEAKTFMALGNGFASHDTVNHSQGGFVRGSVHTNSAEGFSDRIRRTIAGVFHHISSQHADLYLREIGFRWSQRTVAGRAVRQTRKGRSRVTILWTRVPAAQQLRVAFGSIVGRQLRRSPSGGLMIKSNVAVFG